MKKIILLFVLPILIGISNASADDTNTGATNTSPVAVQDMATTFEDTSVEIDLTANDTDAESGALMVTGVSDLLNGTGEITPSGTGVTFTPDQDFNGTGSFTYTVSDGELTATGEAIITVTPVNDAPVAMNDTASTDEGNEIEVDVISNDIDVDGDTLTLTSIGTVLNGEGEINSTGTGIKFDPDSGFRGVVSIDYTVSDGELEDTGNLLISVEEENFPPVAEDDELETDQNVSKMIDPRENDTDGNGDVLNITGATDPNHGTVTYTSVSVTYTPDTDYYGNDRFDYIVSDGNGGTATGVVRVTVNRVEDEDEDDDEDEDEDDGYQFKEKHMVQAVQKEYIQKFKELKQEFKNKEYKNEYLVLKKQLRDEYLIKLKEVTGPAKKYSYEGDSVRTKYFILYESKYRNTISKLSQSGLEIVVGRIDDKIAEINNGNYSDETKAKYNTMLLALRDLVISYMDNTDNILDIDSLFDF